MSKIFADRYRIDRELGRGYFGVVYLAREVRLDDREVALKVLHSGLEKDSGFLRAFEREAGLLARLRHDNIVTIYDANVWRNERYLAMEYINGPSLAQVVNEEGAQPPERVVNWLRDAAQALAYAHGEGFIHRDIKSANLLWDKHRGRLYVTDFGLARAVEMSGGNSERSLDVLTGTAAYRAPEVRKTGHTKVSDLYSLGVVGYELLAGKRPFTGTDAFDIGMAHLTDPVPPLPKSVPKWLARIVMRLLEKNPTNRYPSAAALLADLDKASGLAAIEPISERNRQKPWLSRSVAALLLLGLFTVIAIMLPPILGPMPVSPRPTRSDRPPLTIPVPGAMGSVTVTDAAEEHSGNVAATSTPIPPDMTRPFKPVGGKKESARGEVRSASLNKNGAEPNGEEKTSSAAIVGNILVCVPQDVFGHATIHLWRLAVDRTSWEEPTKFSVGSASLDAATGLVKIPGISIDTSSWGDAGQPYRLELWVDSTPIKSIGNISKGQKEFRVYRGRDNIAPNTFCE